jgi:hypothetical protein
MLTKPNCVALILVAVLTVFNVRTYAIDASPATPSSQTGLSGASDQPSVSTNAPSDSVRNKSTCIPPVQGSGLPCAGTDIPEPARIDAFWEKLLSVIDGSQGYITIDQFEKVFGASFTNRASPEDGHQVATLEGRRFNEFSASLDVYSSSAVIPYWRKIQGELMRGHSVLNVAKGDLGCMPIPKAKQLLEDAKLKPVGAIEVPDSNVSSSFLVFVSRANFQVVTIFYHNGSITAPCVDSIRIIGYEPPIRH